jgi:hypothetical protein
MSHKNSRVPFSCTVVVPYEWVRIIGSCLLPFNLCLFHDELVEGVRISFFSLFSFVLDSRRFRKMWVEPLAYLVFVALLISFL